MTGMPPATAASKLSATPRLSASTASSVPWRASSALLAVTTGLPARSAASTAALATPSSPPINSTSTSMEASWARRSASSNQGMPSSGAARFLPRERAETPATSMSRPTLRARRGPCSANSCNSPTPTVPRPAIPSFSGRFMPQAIGHFGVVMKQRRRWRPSDRTTWVSSACAAVEPWWFPKLWALDGRSKRIVVIPVTSTGMTLARRLLRDGDDVVQAAGRAREELLDVARGLADAVLVLDERDAHEAFAVFAEAQSRRHGDVGLLDQQLGEFHRPHLAIGLGDGRPG